MKRILISAVLLIAISFPVSQAQENKTIGSQLDNATVFFRGAELTHTATAQLTAGENEIYIEGLSPVVDANSLRIKASNNVLITASEFSVDYLSSGKALTPMLKKLQDSITIYRADIDRVGIDMKVNREMIGYLQTGISKNVSGSEAGLGIDELVKTMDYYKSKSIELETAYTELKKRETRLKESVSRLQKQYNQESGKGTKTSGVLKLNVSAQAAVRTTFTITYYTAAGRWIPYYDINIAATDQPIRITAKAKVSQTTGLDWDKVKLTLSTAVPSNGKEAPLFSTWFLQRIQPVMLRGRASGVMANKAVQNTYSYDRDEMVVAEAEVQEMALPAAAPTMDDYITTANNELNVTYVIDRLYAVPGNGKEQSIDLLTKEASAEYKYYSAPKLDPETYLLAEIPDWEKLDLLSAKANITYDGTYVGETYIDARSTHEKLSLSLGTDKRVAVKREKMQDFSSKKSLGSDIQQVFTYKLTVKNNQTRPIRMVLKDQYPKSTDKSIEVKLLKENTTDWTANNEDVGVLSWESEFQPGETKVYQISYSVKYPKDAQLNL